MIFDINYKNEIRDLIDTLNLYTKYYDEGNPKISDTEWDNLYFKLVALENKYNIYFEDSPMTYFAELDICYSNGCTGFSPYKSYISYC